jgi:alpha-glucosidase
MTFENRKDKRLRDRWDQYFFGPDLLVAPVWRVGQRTREVYLPKGRWRSYWDPSQVWKGRRTITVEAPLDHIPVFVRDGAQVPGP